MKIVMLGHSGVGKTTFMACMYAVLQSEIGRFAVIAREQAVHDKLIGIAESVVRGTYPKPTEQQSSYDLVLLLDRKPVLAFEWIDYRGNALNEDGSHSDVQALQAALTSADAIIAFLDGQAVERGERAVREALGRIMVYLNNFMDVETRIMPIAIVLTKADLIEDWAVIMRPLEPLVSAISANRTISGAIIPTTCAKETLIEVDKPTLFALRYGILGGLMRLQVEFEKKKEEALRYYNRSGLLDGFTSWLDNVPSNYDLAQAKAAQADELIRQYNALVDPSNALAEHMTDIFQF
jgi:energy-coupling factor transporter ATP-binding protein EcfA2